MIHRRFASTILLTAFLLAVSTSVTAQNNPYQIADTCYVCMLKADALIGREGFSQANEALLLSAILSKDKKGAGRTENGGSRKQRWGAVRFLRASVVIK